jgi:hypothetical protein
LSPEFRHSFSQELLGGSGSVSLRRILLEDVAIWIRLLDPGNHMLLQKVLINVGVDLFAGANETMGHFWLSLPNTPRTICSKGALDLGKMRTLGSTSATGRSVK